MKTSQEQQLFMQNLRDKQSELLMLAYVITHLDGIPLKGQFFLSTNLLTWD